MEDYKKQWRNIKTIQGLSEFLMESYLVDSHEKDFQNIFKDKEI